MTGFTFVTDGSNVGTLSSIVRQYTTYFIIPSDKKLFYLLYKNISSFCVQNDYLMPNCLRVHCTLYAWMFVCTLITCVPGCLCVH